jgi:hypothetical protein
MRMTLSAALIGALGMAATSSFAQTPSPAPAASAPASPENTAVGYDLKPVPQPAPLPSPRHPLHRRIPGRSDQIPGTIRAPYPGGSQSRRQALVAFAP